MVQPNGLVAATTLSDEEGLFSMVSPAAGTYRMIASRIGYRTSESPELQLMFGDTLGFDFYLSVDAVLVDPIVVTAATRGLEARYPLVGMQGFLRRYSQYAKAGFGEFLTRDSIARYEQKVPTSGHLLMEKMMSVRGLLAGGVQSGLVYLGGDCLPSYFVDGHKVPPDAIAQGEINPMTLYPPETLEAVEVYVRPNIPAEFSSGGLSCGAVSLWTRGEPVEKTDSVPTWRLWFLGLGIIGLAVFVL